MHVPFLFTFDFANKRMDTNPIKLFFKGFLFLILTLLSFPQDTWAVTINCPVGQVSSNLAISQYTVAGSCASLGLTQTSLYCPTNTYLCQIKYATVNGYCESGYSDQSYYDYYDASCEYLTQFSIACCDGAGGVYTPTPSTVIASTIYGSQPQSLISTSSPWTRFEIWETGFSLNSVVYGETWGESPGFGCSGTNSAIVGLLFVIADAKPYHNGLSGNQFYAGCPYCGHQCTVCNAGYYCPGGSINTMTLCSPGAFCTGNAMSNCPTGTFASGSGMSACTSCSPGYYASSVAATVCAYCNPGSYTANSMASICTLCSAGLYSTANAGSSASGCASCPLGVYSSGTGFSSCQICNLGTYNSISHASACLLCKAGTFASNGGVSTCMACTSGTYSTTMGSTGACLSCNPGSYASASASQGCMQCTAGSFSGVRGQSACVLCPVGTYSAYSNSTFCQSCANGYNSATQGGSVCTVCPSGSLPSNAQYISCCSWRCNVGYYNLTSSGCSPCTDSSACSPGYFRPPCTDGVSNTQTCSGLCVPGNDVWANVYWLTSSQNNAANGCLWGCPQGKYKDTVNLLCRCCLVDYLIPNQTTLDRLCSSLGGVNTCPVGQFPGGKCLVEWGVSTQFTPPSCENCQGVTNAILTSQGLPNQAQSCNYTCNAGYVLTSPTSSTPCTQCPQGTFKSAPSNNPCTTCPPGQYQSNVGSVQCAPVPPNALANPTFSNFLCNSGYYAFTSVGTSVSSSCLQTTPGYYTSAPGATTPSICYAGTYTASNGATTCTACVSGTYAPLIAMTTCITWTSTCNAGYSWSAGTATANATCTACPNSTNQAVYLYQSNSCLFTCAAGYQLLNGFCSACPPGTFKADSLSGLCNACPGGQYQSLGMGASVCLNCLAGTFSVPTVNGSTSCFSCGTGLYSTLASGATSCFPCAAGTYSTAIGLSTVCTSCNAGTSSGAGATYCYPLGSLTAYLSPGISPTCQWLYYNYYTSSPCNNVNSVWNENNGPNITAVGTTSSSCNLTQLHATGWTGYVGVSLSLLFLSSPPVWAFAQYQSPTCASYYQSVAAVARIPSNCSSIQAPVTEICYSLFAPGSSQCGGYRTQVTTNAMCHSCNTGYYSQVPFFTTCTACPAGTYSTGVGILDTIEWPTGTYSNSSWMTGMADCRLPQLDANGGWCPATVGTNEWTQLDLGSLQNVKGIVTQGRATAQQWATSINLSYSLDGTTWTSNSILLQGNTNSYSRQINFFSQYFTPPLLVISARYLRLSPGTYNGWFSLRWNALVQLTPCSSCASGYYAPSISSSVCKACPSVPATNVYFPGVGCTWLCNVGYYPAGGSCQPCSNSSHCAVGQYRPICTDGVNDNQTCSGQCTNKPQNTQAIYLGPSTDNTGNSCPWGCNAGFFKTTSQTCSSCQLSCGNGSYASFACTTPSTSAFAAGPQCMQCTSLIPNAFFSGPGAPGNASSCPFTCNYGFYLFLNTCNAWISTCNTGYRWMAGSTTANAQCILCPYAGQAGYVYNQPQTCNYVCAVGYQPLNSSASSVVCVQCPVGTYKGVASTGPCISCPPSTYNSNVGSAQCTPAPSNSIVNSQGTNFICNAGYMTSMGTPIPPTTSCVPCPGYPILNAVQVQWSGCIVQGLACNVTYFYRNWSLPGCIACPAFPPTHAVEGIYNASAFCLTCNSTAATYDMIQQCPFVCNVGYYPSSNNNYSCLPCTSPAPCLPGYYLQMCSGGISSNLCLNCTYQLNVGQMWVAQCQWQCLAGYALNGNSNGCVLCSSGTYKSIAGNQSCIACPPGSYTPTQTSCSQCTSGTYSSMYSSANCIACALGTFSAQNNATVCGNCSACKTCWPNLYASQTASSTCGICSWATPTSLNGVSCGTPNPNPNCPAGYFVNYGATTCTLCPWGVYCTGVLTPVFCPSTNTSVQPAISLKNCTNNTVPTLCPSNTILQQQCIPKAGFYGLPSSGSVTQCPYDAYCPVGCLIPIACPTGLTAPLGSFTVANCTAYMVPPCRPGYYLPNASSLAYCLPCPAGCYCPGPSSMSSIFGCNPASVNYSSPPLAFSSSQCVSPTTLGNNTSSSCPLNTQAPSQVATVVSILQCRANAGYYFIPSNKAIAIPCPINYFCPSGALVPTLCSTPPLVCSQNGTFPTPLLCPQSMMVSPAAPCQTCTGLPLYATWSSATSPSCPFCCQINYYQYNSAVCNQQPDSSTCPSVGQYVPVSGPCAVSVQTCVSCPMPANGFSFINISYRNTLGLLGYGPDINNACMAACALGYYYSTPQCIMCSPGTYKNWVGNSSSCVVCPQGSYAPSAGSTVCKVCPPYSIALPGATVCQCMAGFYRNVSSSFCVACNAGFYSLSGSTTCSQCAPGTRWAPYD